MALLFANQLGLPQPTPQQPWPMEPLWIAFAYYDSSCGAANQNFRKMGWWQINPYQTLNLWNVDLQTVNRYAYFWGATAHQGITWHGTGNAWLNLNPNSAFNQCAFDNTNDAQSVDFVEIGLYLGATGMGFAGICSGRTQAK